MPKRLIVTVLRQVEFEEVGDFRINRERDLVDSRACPFWLDDVVRQRINYQERLLRMRT